MEKYELTEDVKLICASAASFPDGIMDAFNKLEDALPNCSERTWYGLSRMNEKGQIIYKAASIELNEGEAEQTDFEAYTLSKGTYLAETIIEWRKNIPKMGQIFSELLSDPQLDKTSYCVEWYKSDAEVLCMVKLDLT